MDRISLWGTCLFHMSFLLDCYINNVTNKANSILDLLRRNLRIPSHTIKTHAYQSLVRPHLEYASTVWDPHIQKNIHKLDMVQRRAARHACNRYHNISSVTEMVGHLGWEPLATRRRNMRLCMMYKIAHTVVGDPWTEWLTTSKRVTRGFRAWKYIPIYSQHNIYKFSFLPPHNNRLEQSIIPLSWQPQYRHFSS